MTTNCPWPGDDPLYLAYHDNEWGKPQYDNHRLFEQLCLEGQQAGLSWITVLRKRAHYRQTFHHFDPTLIAQMTEADLDRLMDNPNVIRHRAKLAAIVKNAKAYLAMTAAGEDFSHFIWSFVNHQPQRNDIPDLATVPSKTAARAMSKALKQRGFSFIGETTCYAFMQAMGLVDDHLNTCTCKTPLQKRDEN